MVRGETGCRDDTAKRGTINQVDSQIDQSNAIIFLPIGNLHTSSVCANST